MKVQFINAKEKTIETREDSSLEAMQEMVGGMIEVGMEFPISENKTNTLYINEEGLLLEEITWGFSVVSGEQTYSFVGNGCLCGFDPSTGDTVELLNGFTEDQIEWMDEEGVQNIRALFNNGPGFRVLSKK